MQRATATVEVAFPARAGMNRQTNRNSPAISRVLRPRGDEPKNATTEW
ncbi:hypothetical protein TVNIR_2836 [Thioalkalivibrio nitratireducens DSM 14787]|uniref:Uncharacterized protein n=1 Tax=Thioalkalivibrio nitratireducens (strain DSM 14787 / UNIQEM 213 / ALEN2) TaxID=1255043 RepID=L0DY05_THIND|nr:hypothetical protein TVNIR_2836 [Thioalkalivibrio nitratireducens DSM 14787]